MHEIHSRTLTEVDLSQVTCISGIERIQAEFPAYLSDESKLTSTGCDTLYLPKSEEELAAVLRFLNSQAIPVTIAGAHTGLVGGSVPPGGALVSLENLNQIQAVYFLPEADEWRVTAQAGVSLYSLNEFLQSRETPALGGWQFDIKESFALFKSDHDAYFYPPDPTETTASLGGTVATNASGARAYRYGSTRTWVRRLRVFLANGEYLDIPRGKYFASTSGQFMFFTIDGQAHSFSIPDYRWPKTKNTAGLFTAPQMDLIDLFIGSEGILGLVTTIEVALLKRQNKIAMVQFLESDDQAVKLTTTLRSEIGLALNYLEYYSENTLKLLRSLQGKPGYPAGIPQIPSSARSALFFEMDYDPATEDQMLLVLEATVNQVGADLANSWAATDTHEMDDFQRLRHLVPETINGIIAERKRKHPGLHKLGTDLAVPDEHLSEMWRLYQTECDKKGFEWYAFGHIGNNHIHVNILPRDMAELKAGKELFEQFARHAVELGGTVSAEHGIGKLKHNFLKLMYSPAEVDQMRAVKHALDPEGILNPGVLFSE